MKAYCFTLINSLYVYYAYLNIYVFLIILSFKLFIKLSLLLYNIYTVWRMEGQATVPVAATLNNN